MRGARTRRTGGRRPRLAIGALAAIALAGAAAARPGDAADCSTSRIAGVRALACPAPAGAQYPRLSPAPPPGDLLLSWLEAGPGGGHALRMSILRAGSWSRPRTIVTSESLFVNWADFPVVTAMALDRLVATWLVRVGDGPYAYHVRASVGSADGSRWTPPVTVHSDRSETEHGFVSVAREGRGARLAWLDGRKFAGRDPGAPGAEMTVRTAILGADGVVRDERELDGRACDCCNTAAVRAAGGTLVAYRDRDGAEVRDLAWVRTRDGGEPERGLLHADGWTIAGCPVNGPALATESLGGRVGAAWYTEADDRPRVLFAAEAGAGADFSFGPPVPVSEARPLGRVGLSAAGACEFVVSWLEERGDSADVMVRIARTDASLGDPVRVATTSARRSSGFPQVLRFTRGGREAVAVAWTEPGNRPRVRMAWLELR